MNKSIKKVVSIALSATTVVWLTGAGAVLPVAFAQSTASEIASLQALITQLTAQLGALQGSSSVASPVSPVVSVSSGACGFTRNLTVGSTGADVKCLQQYLNGAGFVLASSGAGSPGNETSYFGPITKAAVVKWQDANVAGVLAPVGLAKGTGFWGPSSRGHYDSVAVAAPVVPPVTPGTGTTPVVGTPVSAGGLVVSLGSGSPASANIPKGASSVPFLQLVVSGSGKLDSLTFVRTGLGQVADFSSGGVYLYDGATRLTTGKSVNGTTHEVKFVSLNQAISGSKTYMLVADTSSSATAGNLSSFQLTHVNGEALASAVQGNDMAVSAVTVGGITATKNGSVANPNVGAVGAKLSQFTLKADSVEDLNIRRIVITHGGGVSIGYLTNLELRQAGAKLAKVAGYTGRDLFVFELAEPFKLLKGQTRVFEIYGDVSPSAKSGSSETVKLYLDNNSDLLATGDTYGWGAAPTITAFDSGSSDHHSLTLLGAEMVISWIGPQARNIAAKAQDVVLFEFSISSQNNVEIRNLNFTNTVTYAADGGFNDYKVVDAETGSAVTTSKDLTNAIAQSGASVAAAFTDIVNVSAGSVRRFLVTADIDTDNINNDSIKVSLDAFADTAIKNLDNNTFLTASTDIVPDAAIAGTTQTVKTTSVEVQVGSVPGVHTTVAGAANEDLLGINLTARNGDVKVTSIKVSASSTNGSRTDVQNALRTLGLYVDGNLISSKKSLVNDGTVISSATFSSLDLTIPEGQTKAVVVRADAIATNAAAKVYFVFADKANITTVDMEGNDITPTTAAVNGAADSAGTITVTVGSATISVAKVTDGESEAGNVVVGANGGERLLAKYDFFANNASQTITKLKVGVNTAASVATTSNLSQEVERIILKDSAGVVLASGTPESGTYAGAVRFEDVSGLFTIDADNTKRIDVYANLIKIGTGSTVGALVTGQSQVSSLAAYVGGGHFESVSGATTNTTLKNNVGVDLGVTATDGVAGNLKRTYKSMPTITIASPSSSSLTGGEVELLRFTVAADSAGQISWKKIEATVTLSGATVTANSIGVRDASGKLLSVVSASTTIATTGGQAVVVLADADVQTIAAGGSAIYKLVVDVSAGSIAATGVASVSTKLKIDEASYSDPTDYPQQATTANSFVWSDYSMGQHNTTVSQDWHNGYKVKSLPSSAIALIEPS